MTNENIIVSRKYFIDNIRSFTVLTVVVFHVFYLLNSVGVLTIIGETGIPILDTFCYFVYPWIMPIMFLLAGISTKYALQKRTAKDFLKERVQKLIIPFIFVLLLLGWINIWVLFQYTVVTQSNPLYGVERYIVLLIVGMGPIWFNIQLFIVSLVLLVLYNIDKRNIFLMFADKINIFILLAFMILFWGSSFLLNIPLISVFRNGIYLFCFLVGYYIFSHDKIIETLAKFSIPLLASGIILGIICVYHFYGENFVEDYFLQHPLTNIYSWVIMLAIIGCSKKYFNKTNKILDFVKSRSFFWYLCHYPIMVFMAYILVTVLKLPFAISYILLFILAFGTTIIFCEIVRLIPVLRFLLFGIKKKNILY